MDRTVDTGPETLDTTRGGRYTDAVSRFAQIGAANGPFVLETYPLEHVADAFERTHSGKARFRAVLTLSDSPS